MGDRASAINLFNAAVKATQDRSFKDWATHAFGLFNGSCLLDPNFGLSFYHLGNSNGDLNRLETAVACYRRALRGDLDTVERMHCLSNLAWRLHQIGELEESLRVALECVEFAPELPYGWVNLSVAHGAFGDRIACRSAALKAYELSPDDKTVQFNLAFAYLFNGEYALGLKYFESRFEERLRQYLTYPYPKWNGEPDKTVFLVADQGLGDTLSFSRFIPHAAKKAKYIHAMVQPPLLRAFNEAFVHLPNVNFVPTSTGYPYADVWTTFVSLPYACQLTDQEIKGAPHPRLPVYDISTQWKVPDIKLHIGVQWGGAQFNDIDRWRSFHVNHLLKLYQVPGIQLYSLQVDEHKNEMMATGCEALIRDLSPWINDITDTVSILKNLDMVICCESSLAHIAGTIGKEVWIPYSFHAHDYRLGHNGPILWYKNHRLFLQNRDLRWETCFDNIIAALKERLEERSGRAVVHGKSGADDTHSKACPNVVQRSKNARHAIRG